MTMNPTNVIVTDYACKTCGGESIEVYHQGFPELRVSGQSAGEAAERLTARLESSLDSISDQAHRMPVQQAIGDIRAFLNREGPTHPARDLKIP
ncbi:MAG TPA: hypothetical protein VHE81_08345 [Lacipirellulaceae bacterium]|nr:hypothetical protein [Lacipirellulaceae bacterium]